MKTISQYEEEIECHYSYIFYKLAVLRGSEWICYQGYVFATSQNRAKSILSQRYLTGVIKEPFGANIEPGEDITFRTVERVPVEEGTCL